ncbi:nucleotidyltransferase domain-containing protein [Methanosphaera sp. BMS]|uniref:nucleotidyltransferase domain-containing protein n=1 Tax=Methanosphaera sp. BMS TaxID=1789762 RepID=UPI000DC1CB38|nr:nucleotidyltransferase domain-containing protein [Methanosphaera sp. BMS]AWX33114.1 hypothetical protein AW729_08405 [Methanosphaera sp. BMS]MDO5825907.1 nucleotidyltransferase domain-containing protein [Methanosphaera sp.]
MFNRIKIAKNFAKRIKSDKINQIILFGSVARGDDGEDSDIDILIISPNLNEIQDDVDDEVVEVILETNQFISAHLMTTEHFNKTKSNSFLRNVLKDGVVIG